MRCVIQVSTTERSRHQLQTVCEEFSFLYITIISDTKRSRVQAKLIIIQSEIIYHAVQLKCDDNYNALEMDGELRELRRRRPASTANASTLAQLFWTVANRRYVHHPYGFSTGMFDNKPILC